MKLAQVKRGTKAEKPFALPLPPGSEPAELPTLLVALTDDQDAECHAFAIVYAKEKGAPGATIRDPLYAKGYMAKAVALAAKDPDTGKPGERSPTFTGGEREVLAELDTEVVLYAFTALEDWTSEISPLKRHLTSEAIMAGLRQIAAGGSEGDRFFLECGPAMRRTLLFTSASQLVTLLDAKSSPGGLNESSVPSPPPPSSS